MGQLVGWVAVDDEVDERREMLRGPPKLAMLEGRMGLGSGGGEGGGVPLGPRFWFRYEPRFKEVLEADKKAGLMPGEPGGVYGLRTLEGRLKVEMGLALGGANEGVPRPLLVPALAVVGVKREVVGKKV